MGDTEAIIAAISSLHTEVNNGFNRVYDEIGTVCDRIKPLEDDKIKRDTLASEAEKVQKENVDWGKWSIRGLIAFVALQVAPGAYAAAKRLIMEILGINEP